MTTDILNKTRPIKSGQAPDWILLVDDHPLFCDALELTLGSVMPHSAIKTADRLSSAVTRLSEAAKPALIVLDLNLPDVSGVEGVIEIRRAAPQTPIIVVSSMTDERVISAVMAAGASGFVPKHSSRSVFEDAITKINAGETCFPPTVKPDPENNTTGVAAAERLALLTAQQARILDLICEGKLNKQIAFDLSIAETTVKAHITAIMRKLCVHSRTQAVLVAQNAKFTTILSQGDS